MNQMFMYRDSLYNYVEWAEEIGQKRYALCFWPHDLRMEIYSKAFIGFTSTYGESDNPPLNWICT